ncbi:hypothetical protein V6N13_014459 [Hibiscus sabdariffa]|uniref:Alpha/beta hydrolase fold-3 domain-containing protein n=1 Tax=Hibiscus sabdariffa TaxID=183260 RepID=A0ABR2RVY0_9ROSI
MGSLPHVVEDCFGLLQLYSDGSVYRNPEVPCPTPLLDDDSVLYKDLVFDSKRSLRLRLYKPSSTSLKKLPILFYFHGGGFCFGSFTFPHFHNLCVRMTTALNAVVIAPDHRLAPEHRLPAASDDACLALKWLKEQAVHGNVENMDPWMTGVDFDRVFVLGDSSGGNLAHHLAVRFKAGSTELAPVRVRGFWRLSIPIGSTLDDPSANPLGPYSQSLAEVPLDPIVVVVGGGEILRDRLEDYATRLRELGKKVEFVEFEGQQHGFFTDHPFSEVAGKVLQRIRDFILDNSK